MHTHPLLVVIAACRRKCIEALAELPAGYNFYRPKHNWTWIKRFPLTNATLVQNYPLSATLWSEITGTRKVLSKTTTRKEQISG